MGRVLSPAIKSSISTDRVQTMGISEGLSRMSWKLSRTVLRGGVTGNGDALLGKGEKGGKQPYYVTIPSAEPFAFAGLWETWTDKKSDEDSGMS